MNNGNLGLDRGGFMGHCYSFANAMLMIVPGTALLVFGEGKTLILPEPVIDFLFPFAVPLPERMLFVVLAEKFSTFAHITFADFDRLALSSGSFLSCHSSSRCWFLGFSCCRHERAIFFPLHMGEPFWVF